MGVMRTLLAFSMLCVCVVVNCKRITTRETSTCAGRQSPGPICETCELLATCVRHSNGWVNIPVETCDTANGYYCNSRLGMCSNMTGPCHPFGYEGNFPCTSHGIFPDPYDCQKYHMCYFVGATLVSATVDCGGDRAFDAATGQCTSTLDDEVCQQRQFDCQSAGIAQPWPKNPNIFYVCKATSNQAERILFPTLYRCDDGDIFDGYYCMPIGGGDGVIANTTNNSIGSNNNSLNLNKTHNNNNNSNTTEHNNNSTQIFVECTNVGLFADPDNCRKYFYCSGVSNGQLRHMECPLGTYYNIQLSSCTVGSC